MNSRGKWTPDTDELLARLLAAREPIDVIADRMGRTESAIRSRTTRNARRSRTGRPGDPLGSGARARSAAPAIP
jgi:hypothetical protein